MVIAAVAVLAEGLLTLMMRTGTILMVVVEAVLMAIVAGVVVAVVVVC